MCLRIAAEKILFLCLWEVPEGDSEDYSVLIPGRTSNGEDIATIAVRSNSKTDVIDKLS